MADHAITPPTADRFITVNIFELPLRRFWRWAWRVDEGFEYGRGGTERTRAKAVARAEEEARRVVARRAVLDAAERTSYDWPTP